MKRQNTGPRMLVTLGLFASFACAEGEDLKPAAMACDELRECCHKMDENPKAVCLQTVESRKSNSNKEPWCRATVDSYEQQGACARDVVGSGGKGTVGSSSPAEKINKTGSCEKHAIRAIWVDGTEGSNALGGSGGTGGGSCLHDECSIGDALDPSCSSCAATVCASDPFCCDNHWNGYCVDGAKNLCGRCGGGTAGSESECAHDECTIGDALDASCSPCVADVCSDDAYGCTNGWNSYGFDGARELCNTC